MEPRLWLDQTNSEMARQGVPARQRLRLLAEWREHLQHLTDEDPHMQELNTETTMGTPRTVASAAAAEFRRSRWTTRHPLLVFGLAPVPILFLVMIGLVIALELGIVGVCELVLGEATPSRKVLITLIYVVDSIVRFAPLVFAAVLFTRLYLRSSVAIGWYAVALGQLILFAATFVTFITLSDTPGHSQWGLGFVWIPIPTENGWALPFVSMAGFRQVVQVLATLGVAAAFWRWARRQPTPELILA
ncbi:MAG: hypothetical protein ACRCZF_02640 [Gemmataceae bacterium]